VIVAVSDAGPLIHLAAIDSLDLLSVVDTLLVPDTVWAELDAGGVPDGLADVPHERVEAEKDTAVSKGLDAGETAALAIAIERDAVLLTDDLEARRAAKTADVEVHGSVGVIVLAFTRGELDRQTAVDRMRALQTETSLFVTDAVVERGIELLDESGR
jgi:predicted nucleic acid-binding protein